MARGEHGHQVRGTEWASLAATAVAGEHPGGLLAGRVRLAEEFDPEARRGGRRGGAPRVVELGEVGGQGRVIELLAGEPGVELEVGRSVGGGGGGEPPTDRPRRRAERPVGANI